MDRLTAYLSKNSHLPAIDGLRGLAVLVVVLFHGTVNGPRFVALSYRELRDFGWMGVDLFFVLSGFLITGILHDTRGQPRYFSNFYARRALRIMPLYFVYLAIFFAIYGHIDSFWHQLLHLSNFRLSMAGSWFKESPANLTWSLSIEEQYYLLWPLAVFYLTRRPLLWLLGLTLAASVALRYSYAYSGFTNTTIYTSTLCRLDGLALGSMLALAVRSPGGIERIARHGPLLFPMGLLGIAVIRHLGGTLNFYAVPNLLLPWLFTSTALVSGGLLATVISRPTRLLESLFANRVLCALGRHSFAMYLLHVEIIRALAALWPMPDESRSELSAALFQLAGLGLTFLAALLVWHLFEARILRLKRHFST